MKITHALKRSVLRDWTAVKQPQVYRCSSTVMLKIGGKRKKKKEKKNPVIISLALHMFHKAVGEKNTR